MKAVSADYVNGMMDGICFTLVCQLEAGTIDKALCENLLDTTRTIFLEYCRINGIEVVEE